MEILSTLKMVMLAVSVSIETALREGTARVGEQFVPLDVEPFGDAERELLSRRLSSVPYEHPSQKRYSLCGRFGGVSPLAMPTARITSEAVRDALAAWVRDELAYEASLAAEIMGADVRGALGEMLESSVHYPTSIDIGAIRFKSGSAADKLWRLNPAAEALKLMAPAIDAAREQERERARASYLARIPSDLITYSHGRRCVLSPGVRDAETEAHEAAAQKLLADRIAQEELAAAKAEELAAAKAAEKKQRAEALRQYVIANAPDYADGAREDYDVTAAAAHHVAETVRSFNDGEVVTRGSARFGQLKFEEAPSPRKRSIVLRDSYEKSVETLREQGKLPADDIVEVDVMRVQRVTDTEAPVTTRAVVIKVTAGNAVRFVIFPAE